MADAAVMAGEVLGVLDGLDGRLVDVAALRPCFHHGQGTTIEPGLYIPGWGGVRIEDQVIIREGGVENLIRVTHDLIEL